MIGKYVIVRGEKSGVFAGTLVIQQGREVELKDCRRLWYWDGAASISQLAVNGTTKPNTCKFTVIVSQIVILDVIEIIHCTGVARASIAEVKEWKL